jgi:hypothetical protein
MIVLTVEFTRILFPGGEKPLSTSNAAYIIPLDAPTLPEVTESADSCGGIHFKLPARMCSNFDCTPKLNEV